MLVQSIKHLFFTIVLLVGLPTSIATAMEVLSDKANGAVVSTSITETMAPAIKAEFHYVHEKFNHTISDHNTIDGECHCCLGSCSSLLAHSINQRLSKPLIVFNPILKVSNINRFIDPHFRPPII